MREENQGKGRESKSEKPEGSDRKVAEGAREERRTQGEVGGAREERR